MSFQNTEMLTSMVSHHSQHLMQYYVLMLLKNLLNKQINIFHSSIFNFGKNQPVCMMNWQRHKPPTGTTTMSWARRDMSKVGEQLVSSLCPPTNQSVNIGRGVYSSKYRHQYKDTQVVNSQANMTLSMYTNKTQ